MNEKVKLGCEAKDKITGFSGIVVSVTEFMYGCRRLELIPRTLGKDGKVQEGAMFDEPQLEVIGTGMIPEVKEKKPAKPRHGDRSFRPRRTGP